MIRLYTLPLLLSLFMVPSMGFSTGKIQPIPVEKFDINRYLGTWHQLAVIPASFQKDCVTNTTATYSKAEDGLIKVVNRCEKKDGEYNESEARARKNAKYKKDSALQVTFAKVLGRWVWSVAGDYWVLSIDKDYQLAIVGHPDYSFGWILSRQPTIGRGEYRKLAATLKEQGYDTCKFEMSNTPAQDFPKTTTLCDYAK